MSCLTEMMPLPDARAKLSIGSIALCVVGVTKDHARKDKLDIEEGRRGLPIKEEPPSCSSHSNHHRSHQLMSKLRPTLVCNLLDQHTMPKSKAYDRGSIFFVSYISFLDCAPRIVSLLYASYLRSPTPV